MRIGVDARALTVPIFGIGRYTLCLLDEMKKLPDITWYLYADRPIIHPVEGDNIVVRQYPSHNRVLSLLRTQLQFARWAKQDRLTLFWSPRHHLPLILSAQVKTVVTIHDLVWRKFPETMLSANLLVERCLMPPSLKKANKIIAVSQSTCNDILELYPKALNKSVVIHSATSISAQVETEVERRPHPSAYFLFVGTLEPRKNLVSLLAAYEQYRTKGGTHDLIIIGAKGWKQGAGVIKEFSENSHLLGRVEDAELMAYYQFADALVFPSLYEGFGLPALEAMQFGVPVIGSNRSSLPEVIGAGGILVNPLSIDAISEAMLNLSSDKKLRERLSKEALLQAAKFSWQRAAEETMAVFKDVQGQA